ncbi:MAG: glycoside hydrolase family 2 protein [Planctomycetota bacterium]|jgi:beta-galactosidase/beta-glucuronidase
MESKRSKRGLFHNKTRYCIVTFVVLMGCSSMQAEWKPADGPLMTRWAKEVSPDNAHPEYPRPQMVRKDWLNLNGLWEYAITAKDESKPAKFDGQILVPYPVESALSGVMKKVGEKNRLWYRRTFRIPRKWKGQRVLLHFGAVDWDATVWVNGKRLGNHRGGYDPFTFDVTDALKETGKQEIILSVWDPTNTGSQPRGKQVKKPGGIMYTAVTGIWQTVWLEPVPETYIEAIRIVPDVDNNKVQITANVIGDVNEYYVNAVVKIGDFNRVAGGSLGLRTLGIKIPEPKLWSPDSPALYDLKVKLIKKLKNRHKTYDEVGSYFGMRKIEIKKDEAGINRLLLNNKVLFQYGPLDQGWWPDGLYTAPTDEALRYDIEVLKKIGCNMLRKHVKVEPARLYYWCDKLGLMVWQDMASGNNKTVRRFTIIRVL